MSRSVTTTAARHRSPVSTHFATRSSAPSPTGRSLRGGWLVPGARRRGRGREAPRAQRRRFTAMADQSGSGRGLYNNESLYIVRERSTDRLLVGLLHEAAQLEHCLLCSYLYAGCSLKSFPEEFATLPDGRENRRRAIQYERVRAWKQAILEVATEEMLHLHYVQCLLRALGERPYFELPERDSTGNWFFGNWQTRVGSPGPDVGTEVPVAPVTPGNLRRLVLYESTDAMQDKGLFGPEAMDLFRRLHAFEVELLLESVLYDVSDDSVREALKAKLHHLYDELTPGEPRAVAAAAAAADVDVGDFNFQSIADLYNKGILPLYQEAFDQQRVPYS